MNPMYAVRFEDDIMPVVVHCPECGRPSEVVRVARINDQHVLYQCRACHRVFEELETGLRPGKSGGGLFG